MKKDFDHIATNYDVDFTLSEIGKKQRNSVYKYLEKLSNNLSVLELNCGTGEDAIWLSQKGNKVLATDISEKMIIVASKKAKGIENLDFQQLDINKLNKLTNQKFDLVFSNFGGLNCLNHRELKEFFKSVTNLLTKKGKLVLVIMPKNTLWEQLYFTLKGQVKKGFRRNTHKSLAVNVAGLNVKTWYYNPKNIKELSSSNFKIVKTKPIGFFIPPSYLEPFFRSRPKFLAILDTLEKWIGSFGFLSRFSDHYIIELQKESQVNS